jgi:transaldolase
MYIEELKFSLWADFIEREYLENEFRELINEGMINGATSNPAIFKSAILSSPAYKEHINALEGKSAKEKYEALAMYDITKAADILKPLYEAKDDGYVSIEVDPYLCNETHATVEEGKRLYETIDRENVMIKVPATKAGYAAMTELVADGIPVNATLIFSKEQAISCAKAFAEGVKRHGSKVDTVISVFVSRVDRALDAELAKNGIPVALSGIYNSADIYNKVNELKVEGCRVLFASTGVKDNSLPADYYVQNLLAYNSVNTAPIETIKAFHKNGTKIKALPIADELIQEHFARIAAIGINFDEVLETLVRDGLEAFKDAFKDILEAL